MNQKNRIIGAITTAIGCYLQAEQQAVTQMTQRVQPEKHFPSPKFSPWVQAGRQSVMERNFQFQFRLYR